MEIPIWTLVENSYGLTEDVKTFLTRDQAVVEAEARMSKHIEQIHDTARNKQLWEGTDNVECGVCYELIISIHGDTIELIDDRIG